MTGPVFHKDSKTGMFSTGIFILGQRFQQQEGLLLKNRVSPEPVSGNMRQITSFGKLLGQVCSITTVLKVKKSTDSSFTILAGKYNPGIFGVEIMTVNAIPGSGYNFFERDQLATAIHETSHAGGADDYYDSNNNVDPRWDNAYIIENIANGGIRGVLHSLQMPLECKCE